MIAALVVMLASPQAITVTPLREVHPNPRFKIACELRDLDFKESYRLAFTQYGGIYEKRKGDSFGARGPRYFKFDHDDLGIFDNEPVELAGMAYSDWYSVGPAEMISKSGRGALTFYKTTPRQPLNNPGKIAVTVRGGRYTPNALGKASLEEFVLVGSCNVSWEEQVS